MLLQAGQLLSSAGTQATSVAYPLLVLAADRLGGQGRHRGFARTLPAALLALPAGVAADRWSRRRQMIAADAVRVLAVGSLAAAILLGEFAFWVIPTVAFLEGAGAALFSAAHAGALRAVVPAPQLPAAAGAQTGRQAAVQLAGPPLGGALFASPARFRSWSTRSRTPSRPSRSWPCGRRSRRRARETAPRSGRSLPRASASCGASRSCAPAPSSSAWPTSSALGCCLPSS